MRLFDKRAWYFFLQKISLGKRERYFLYVLIGILVGIEAVNQSKIALWKPPVHDYSKLDSLISERTAKMQAAYDSLIALRYEPNETEIATLAEAKEESPKRNTVKKAQQNTIENKKPIKININTATLSEWIQVPGIGEKTAQIILDYRLKEGPFSSLEDLTKVRGIGPKKLEKLREFLMLD